MSIRMDVQDFGKCAKLFLPFTRQFFFACWQCRAEKCVGLREARIKVLSVNPETRTEIFDGENESGTSAEAGSGF